MPAAHLVCTSLASRLSSAATRDNASFRREMTSGSLHKTIAAKGTFRPFNRLLNIRVDGSLLGLASSS